MKMEHEDDGGDRQLIRAVAHPLRVKILRWLESEPSSPKRLAVRSGEELANVSYHMGVLLECGCVELVETIPRRGAVEHVYKLTPQGGIGSRVWQDLPASLRSSAVGGAFNAFIKRVAQALEGGTVESREGSGITWLPLMVDEKGWSELRQISEEAEARFRRVAEESADRMKDATEGISVIVAIAAFEQAGGKAKGS